MMMPPVENIDAQTENFDVFEYEDNGDGTATITGYNGSGGDITIPEKIDNLIIIEIKERVFEGKNITGVTLPNTLRIIGEEAFANNKIYNVTIPESVTSIGDKAFHDNLIVYAVIKNDSVTFGEEPFDFYPSSLPTNIRYFQLTLIGHKSSTTEDYVNKNLSNNVIFKDILTAQEVDYDVNFFETELNYPGYPNPIKMYQFVIKKYKGTKKEIIIPEQLGAIKVQYIDKEAFKGAGLESVTFPPSTNEIRIVDNSKEAFADNSENFAIICYNSTSYYIYNYAQQHNYKILDIEDFPEYVYKWEQNSDGTVTITNYLGYKKIIEIPEKIKGMDVKIIGLSAFSYKGITSVTIPDTVETIEGYAFYQAGLEKVTLGENVKTIGTSAFYKNKLTSIKFGEKIESIGPSAFENNQLETLEIPKKVSTIMNKSFAGNKLKQLIIPDTVTYIASYAFQNNQLSEVTVYNKNTEFAYEAPFQGNQSNPKDLTFISYANSKAKQYAQANNHTFITFEEQQFDWEIKADGTVKITGYKGTVSDVVIPTTINEKTVTEIADGAFKDLENVKLKSITIPSVVTTIGSGAFQNNELTKVNLPSSVKTIGDSAFQNNKISSLSLAQVQTIGNNAFKGNDIESISLPNSVISIGNGAFKDNKLTKVEFGNQLSEIGEETFSNNRLKTILLPQNIQKVEKDAFSHNQLSIVEVKNKDTIFVSEVFSNNQENPKDLYISSYNTSTAKDYANQYGHTFSDMGMNGYFTITQNNDGTATIKTYTGDEQIKEVVIPAIIDGYKITKIGSAVFLDPKFEKVIIPRTVTHVEKDAFATIYGSTSKLEEVVLGENVTYIGQGAFSGNKIKSIDIPDSVQKIGPSAFSNNTLQNVKIGAGLTKIESSVFVNNPNLKSIVIPDNVTEIGDGAFIGCNLENVVFSKNLTTIGERAFFQHKLKKIDIPDSVTTIGKEAFLSNYLGDDITLEEVTLGNSVTTIGFAAFRQNKIKEITIPASVETMGEYAFANNSLEKVTFETKIENGVKKGLKIIPERAFSNNNIREIDIPDTVETIGILSFYNNNLKKVKIGSNVQRIEKNAFYMNFSIQNITLPESVEYVGDSAFASTNISKVIVLNKNTEFDQVVFHNSFNTNKKAIKIIGYDPSTAKTYAENNDHEFINGSGIVTFSTNGDTEWKKEHSVRIDVSGYKEDEPLEYAWSTSENVPSNGWNTISNGSLNVTTPENVTGKYYLHVKGTSLLEQPFNAKTAAFYVDNTSPSISINQYPKEETTDNVTITVTGNDNDSGIKRIQDPKGTWHNGAQLNYVVEQNDTYTFIVEDNAGNQAQKQITINNIKDGISFEVPNVTDNVSLTITNTYPTNTINVGKLKVEDWRKNINNDWSISVFATPLKMVNGNKLLPVGTIRLRPITNIRKMKGDGNLPVATTNNLTVIDDEAVTIARGTGSKGDFELEFQQSALELWIDPTKVYIDDVINGTKYKTTLTWNLITAP